MNPPQIATIPAHLPFLDVLARAWLAQAGGDALAVADGLILLPTRRAARALHDAFLRATDGEPLLLPRIAAIGAPDETPYTLSGALGLPQPIAAPVRLAMLSKLILKLDGNNGAPPSADRAWPLAASLAQLLDEAARAEIDLAHALTDLVHQDFANHWQQTTKFLEIVTERWPHVLAAEGLSDVAAHQVRLLRAEAARWQEDPPQFPVWAAGSTGGIGAVARLLAVVSRLPRGQVILPGLDLAMPAEAWNKLEPGHPQASLRALLGRMGIAREDVTSLPGEHEQVAASRVRALNLALLPADFLPQWRSAPPEPLGAISLLEPSDQQEEALAIAIALRAGLASPGHRVALITPDRGLATRVAAELGRFGVVADDSAGEPLIATPPAVFLRLLMDAVRTGLAPVALLSLLKHPFAAFGMPPALCRDAARQLEKSCLRGPAPAPGAAGLRRNLTRADTAIDRLLAGLDSVLGSLAALCEARTVDPGLFLDHLIRAGERAATTDEIPGAKILWAMEEGEALAETLAALGPAFDSLPAQDPGALPGLFATALEGTTVRSRRALRGRASGTEHPRVFIWGLLEARLQTVDLAILGGLTEAIWPPVPDPGPWMNRKMREAAGLPSPEEPVEQAAHDYVMAACCAPQVILSVPKRRDGAPAVPARFVTRLLALLRGWGQTIPAHPSLAWARQLDRPERITHRAKPEPRPPVATRPVALSVSDVELWFDDPYGLYAKHILGLRRLDPLQQNVDSADFGNLVHGALASYYQQAGSIWPDDAALGLEAVLLAAIERDSLRPAIANWWKPRLARIARFVADAEYQRREAIAITDRRFEIKAEKLLPGGFTLRCRADRVERIGDNAFAIIDYKTGVAPSQRHVEDGLSPQLPLEAMLLQLGGFGPDLQGEVHELAFWKLSGGSKPGEVVSLWSKANQDQRAETERTSYEAYITLLELVRRFQDPDQPYRSAPDPSRKPRFSDYAQLARRSEWMASDDDFDADGEPESPLF